MHLDMRLVCANFELIAIIEELVKAIPGAIEESVLPALLTKTRYDIGPIKKVWPKFAVFLLTDKTQLNSQHPAAISAVNALEMEISGNMPDWLPIRSLVHRAEKRAYHIYMSLVYGENAVDRDRAHLDCEALRIVEYIANASHATALRRTACFVAETADQFKEDYRDVLYRTYEAQLEKLIELLKETI